MFLREWPALKEQLSMWLEKTYDNYPTEELDRILDAVTDTVMRWLKKNPDKSLEEIRKYAYGTAKTQAKESWKRMKARKSKEDAYSGFAEASGGPPPGQAVQGHGAAPAKERWERLMRVEAGIAWALASLNGDEPAGVIVYAGKPSRLSGMTVSCIARGQEYLKQAIRNAPVPKRKRERALTRFNRLVKEGVRRARVSYEDIDPHVVASCDEEEMNMALPDGDSGALEPHQLSQTARECARMLRNLRPELTLVQAMRCAVMTEEEIYKGPDQGESAFLFKFKRDEQEEAADQEPASLDSVATVLGDLFVQGDGHIDFLTDEGEVTLMQICLERGVGALWLPMDEAQSETVALDPEERELLEQADLERFEFDEVEVYGLEIDVEGIDDLHALFELGRDLLWEVFGIEALELGWELTFYDDVAAEA